MIYFTSDTPQPPLFTIKYGDPRCEFLYCGARCIDQ